MKQNSANDVLATMITTTSYGTWLPGDARGYVEHGRLLPESPLLNAHAKSLLTSEPVFFSTTEQDLMFESLCQSSQKYHYQLFAVSVDSWHLHWLINHHQDPVSTMVGRLKNAMRQKLNRGRIWTKGYNKRYCYSEDDVYSRMAYIQRHRGYRTIPQ